MANGSSNISISVAAARNRKLGGRRRNARNSGVAFAWQHGVVTILSAGGRSNTYLYSAMAMHVSARISVYQNLCLSAHVAA